MLSSKCLNINHYVPKHRLGIHQAAMCDFLSQFRRVR